MHDLIQTFFRKMNKRHYTTYVVQIIHKLRLYISLYIVNQANILLFNCHVVESTLLKQEPYLNNCFYISPYARLDNRIEK